MSVASGNEQTTVRGVMTSEHAKAAEDGTQSTLCTQ